MRFQSGKYEGKTTEEVLLKYPDWARWNTRNYGEAKHSREFGALAKKFTAKPFVVDCAGGHCGKKATRASAYQGSGDLMFWCIDCSPSQSGAEPSKLKIVKTIGDVLDHVEFTMDANRGWARIMVRSLAEAKGLPKRVGEKQALAFFL